MTASRSHPLSHLAAVSAALPSDLKSQLRMLTPISPGPASTLPSGIALLDTLLPGGGIPEGRLTELSGNRSCGKRSVALAFATRVLAERRRVAWLDGRGGFYPVPPFEHGAPLEQLLVVRLAGRRLRDVLKATDMLLQTNALALIVLDADLHRRRPSAHQFARLRLSSERAGTALLFISESERPTDTSLGTFIALHLSVQREGLRDLRLTIVKSKLGQMAHQTKITLDATHGLHLDPTV